VLPFLLVRLLSFSLGLAPDPAAIAGIVVDPSGRPLPRAVVQILTRDGGSAATVFTAADGTFRLTSAPAGCRVEASLTGFSPESADCRSDAPLRLVLRIAPVDERIVVSATRTEAPAGQVASSVTAFDAADLERRQQPVLADLLREAPGTAMVATGAPGSVTSLFVRGGESNYTKVLVDGVPINEPGGAFNLSNVTTENVERVEFVRGANSALFGSDAMTGVVQLFTRRGTTARPQARFSLEGGSFSTARAAAGLSGRNGRTDYAVDVAGFTTDNEVPNNAFDNTTVSASGGTTIGRSATLRTVARLERGTTGTPGATAFGRPDLDADYVRHDGLWGVSFDMTSGRLQQRATYGLAVSHQRSKNLLADAPYVPAFGASRAPFAFSDFTFDQRTDLTRHRASYQVDGTVATAHGGTHVDTALVDWDGERATLGDALAGTSQPAARDNVALSLQHQALWSRLFVTGGVRFEHNETFGSAAVPRAGAAWYAHTGTGALGTTRLHATAGLGIKEPTILQSFSTNPFFLGNPELRPERARTVDVGVEQRLARDRVRLDVTWFANRYRNIIALGESDPVTFASQYFNIGLTRARGAELSGDVALAGGFRAKAAYTFLDSKILESTSDFSEVLKAGNPAFRRPRHSGFLDLAWYGGRASADVIGTFSGERSDSDLKSLLPPILVNGAYADWSLRASLVATRALSLTAAIDNLSNNHRMEPLGYPVLSRAVRGGVRVRF
jgi:vitamin B12 transporter